jgi:hypothetical protein
MKIYSYIVAVDKGFAPNPFYGYCSLACCKPKIRSTAKEGDWIIGLSRKSKGNKVIYAMEITEDPIPFNKYFLDSRFKKKIPDMHSNDPRRRRGDNIYQPIGNDFNQLHSTHSNKDGTENIKNKKHDLGSKQVLISKRFFYFGKRMKELPKTLQFLIAKRNHKSKFDEKQIAMFQSFVKKYRTGVYGSPSDSRPENDNLWKCL